MWEADVKRLPKRGKQTGKGELVCTCAGTAEKAGV